MNDFRAQVLQATDIVELISQTVALKRRGKDYLGLCPFHQEKTPSFHVSPSKQSFYCFGCKAGGTAFDFVMKRDRVEFKEALEALARRANLEMPHYGGSGQKAGERQALLEAHSAACRFFENLFWDEQRGSAAREYLYKRGFTPETLRRFQVGLAADAWDALLKGPVGRKFPPEVLAKAGLVKARQNGEGFYDTFRNRIMFPIRTSEGQIIAFGGRIMPGSEDPAKYLNSPETPLFNKSTAVYALDAARQRIVETRSVAITEGYTDSIMAHQFGASNVVSVLGTALTEQHVTVLRRFADRIVLLFDADTAGDLAVDRVVQLFLTQPVEIAVASMPSGLDPDEFLLKYGLEEFDRLIAGASDALTYAWKQLKRRYVAAEGDLTGQQKAVEQYLELLSAARGSGPVDSLRWGAALVRVSKLTEIPAEELNRRFKVRRKPPPRPVAQEDEAQEPIEQSPAEPAAPVSKAREIAERRILGILLIEPQRWLNVQSALHVEDFVTPSLRMLAEVYYSQQRDEGVSVFREFLASLEDASLKTAAIELADEAEDLADRQATLDGDLAYLDELRRRSEDRKLLSGAGEADDERLLEMLKRKQETARRPDLRKLGPGA